MSTRCMFGDGSCPKEQAWHCHVTLVPSGKPADRSLCEEHADLYMRANIIAGHGAFAVPAVPLQVSEIVWKVDRAEAVAVGDFCSKGDKK